ncbi:hypothetical protein WBP06_20245 [Novosphingobium sp. BL-8H]|uniref:hypothetical protein n=1 Tax=Novosphingobium sp. BL-8H TaxID=3127640 RepID=UPI0037577D2A
MALLQVFADAMWMVGGSLIAAIILAWLGWTAFKWAHHPEFGVPVMMTVCLVAALTIASHSEFLKMILFYSSLLAVALRPAGRAWRKNHDL